MAMNGPSSMYKLKPVFKLPEKLDLPTCMYPMKSVLAGYQGTSNTMEKDVKTEVLQEITDKKPLPEVAALEARWTSVLEQLSDLKKQMAEIRQTINSVDVKPVLIDSVQLGASSLSNLKSLNGAVINASPSNPPYSLLLIKELYKNSIQVSISCHVHSTVKSLPEISERFNDAESGQNDALKLLLIWKEDLLDTELVIHPVKQIAIKGEINILRYLGRLGLSSLGYPSDDVVTTIQIDNVLDTCHRLLHVRTAKEKTSIYRNLNAKLGKGSYFGGENVNIIDIAAWSVLKQACANPGSDLTQNLVKWFQRIEQLLE